MRVSAPRQTVRARLCHTVLAGENLPRGISTQSSGQFPSKFLDQKTAGELSTSPFPEIGDKVPGSAVCPARETNPKGRGKMIRNLKALGLALVAVFALSAVATSVASAQQGTITSTGPFTLTGTETGGEKANALTAFGLRVECPTIYTGHKYNVTPHELVPSGATTITITAHYEDHPHGCIVNPGGFRATIDQNSCDYVAHLGETTGGVAGTYGVTFDIVCPPGQEITITIATNAADLTAGKFFCVQHVPPQVGLIGAHATDTGNGHVDLTGPVKGIKITETASATHPVLCPKKESTAAEFDLDITGKAHNAAKEPTAISLSHP